MPTTTITAEKTGDRSYFIYRQRGSRARVRIGSVFFIKRLRGRGGWVSIAGRNQSIADDRTPEAAAFRRWGAAARDAVKAAAAPKNPTADLAAINVWAP